MNVNESWLQTCLWVENTLENCRMLLREMGNKDEARHLGYRVDALNSAARCLYHGEDDEYYALVIDVKALFNFIMEKTK